jgi:ATP citrate (pro-S)-lyase
MAQKRLREVDAKRLLQQHLQRFCSTDIPLTDKFASVSPSTDLQQIAHDYPWLKTERLVVKPDQLLKRRGKAGLLLLNAVWDDAVQWIKERMGKTTTVDSVTGVIDTFIVEPFVPHAQSDEYYVCLQSGRDGDEILFHHEGGVDIGDVDAKAARLAVPSGGKVNSSEIEAALLQQIPAERRQAVAAFVHALLKFCRDLHFCYLEMNPVVWLEDKGCVVPLDVAAKVDECAEFLCHERWGDLAFPTAFGRPLAEEEAYIRDLDSKTGASLKLTLLNPNGRVWTMVAGGGASVVYADTISDLGMGGELANYGEYSGAPSENMTYEYARTILRLMTKGDPVADGGKKVLIIGGGIANFTDVAATFKGIVHALKEHKAELQRHRVHIFVRRGGPNYEAGLKSMRECGKAIGVPMEVHGPEADIVDVVPAALAVVSGQNGKAGQAGPNGASAPPSLEDAAERAVSAFTGSPADAQQGNFEPRFGRNTRAIVFGLQRRAVQGMLDFDFLCKRDKPSVAAMVFPFSGNHYLKFYFGTEETLIPVFRDMGEALRKHPDASVMVNFASFRSVYGSTMEALGHPQLKTIAVIAEGVPERRTKLLNRAAAARGVTIVGPATVGGIKPGCFRIGNTGGMIDNIIASKLYRPGSVAYVSRSGGMSNELNNIISKNTNGVYEGVAIGGDRYPGTRFIDHLLRFNDDPSVAMLVLLGEVGGVDEYAVAEALRSGRVTKPLVCWCIGTCAKIFPFEVQFGHAGALAHGRSETADAKNAALRAAGAVVPRSFHRMGDAIRAVYDRLVAGGRVRPAPEQPPPKMPMDFNWAKKLGLIRKPANFVSSICDDRGEELLYSGMPISRVFAEGLGIGGVLSLLWFRRRLPIYATKFIEMVLMVTADHGPAVSGAHNTIVTTRAGKDLISSLCSGLLTIGPRFGGALDAAATTFAAALAAGESPKAFVQRMRSQKRLIMGIGHKIKSTSNPDMRVTIVKEFAREHFPATPTLDFALEVEKITTKKKANLILNVDGCIAVCFVDLMKHCGAFEESEAAQLIENGCLNGLFVLGRSIGFIGHYLDQKRLKQPLYRHPWDDISFVGHDA